MNNETFSPSLLLTIILFAAIAIIGTISSFYFFPLTTSFITIVLVTIAMRFFRKRITYFMDEPEPDIYSDSYLKTGKREKQA